MKLKKLLAIFGICLTLGTIFLANTQSYASLKNNHLSAYLTNNLKINPNQFPCDIKCKAQFERYGSICVPQSNGYYFCKRGSMFYSSVIIPSNSSTTETNFIPSIGQVSLELDNTVTWTNQDKFSHRVIGENESFDSGVIEPNQTWGHVFEKSGIYKYHGDHPWLKGQITVINFQPDRNTFESPVVKHTSQIEIFYLIFQESVKWGYVKSLKVYDNNTVSITLSDRNQTNSKWLDEPITKTFKIGDSFIDYCMNTASPQVGLATVTKIVTSPVPYIEIKNEDSHIADTKCFFNKLES